MCFDFFPKLKTSTVYYIMIALSAIINRFACKRKAFLYMLMVVWVMLALTPLGDTGSQRVKRDETHKTEILSSFHQKQNKNKTLWKY